MNKILQFYLSILTLYPFESILFTMDGVVNSDDFLLGDKDD